MIPIVINTASKVSDGIILQWKVKLPFIFFFFYRKRFLKM